MNILGKFRSLKYVCREFYKNTQDFSLEIGIDRFMPRIPFLSSSGKREWHQKFIYRYIRKKLLPVIRQTVAEYNPDEKKLAAPVIWVIWWQGIEGMPELVYACYKQLLSVKKQFQVVLITEKNYKDYIELPDYILKKVQEGKISLTHLSDIIRCKLLLDYGGLYLDATIYTSDISIVEDYDFYTLRTPGKYPGFISNGRWSCFTMYEKYTNALFMRCLYNCFCKYWNSHSEVVDYLMFDHMIKCIYEEVEEIRRTIELIPQKEDYYQLGELMNEVYRPEVLNQVLSDCCFQKLSYKSKLEKYTADGLLSNYGYISAK